MLWAKANQFYFPCLLNRYYMDGNFLVYLTKFELHIAHTIQNHHHNNNNNKCVTNNICTRTYIRSVRLSVLCDSFYLFTIFRFFGRSSLFRCALFFSVWIQTTFEMVHHFAYKRNDRLEQHRKKKTENICHASVYNFLFYSFTLHIQTISCHTLVAGFFFVIVAGIWFVSRVWLWNVTFGKTAFNSPQRAAPHRRSFDKNDKKETNITNARNKTIASIWRFCETNRFCRETSIRQSDIECEPDAPASSMPSSELWHEGEEKNTKLNEVMISIQSCNHINFLIRDARDHGLHVDGFARWLLVSCKYAVHLDAWLYSMWKFQNL